MAKDMEQRGNSKRSRSTRSVVLRVIDILMIPPAVILVLVVRLAAPVVLIRFGALIAERIGHFAANTERYLCMRDDGAYGKRVVDIFFCTTIVSNEQLKKMIGRVVCIFPFTRILDRVNRIIPGGKRHMVRLPLDRDIIGDCVKDIPHLAFTKEEIERGEIALRAMGIPKDNSYMCLYMRDSSYLNAVLPGRNWNYHNYRDIKDVKSYLAAAEELTKRGYYVLRMGAIVKNPLDTLNPMVIDYATKFQTDFLDIYLCATCRFFLGSEGGLTSVARIFQRPIAWANCAVIEHVPMVGKDEIIITKKFKYRNTGRLLTYNAIVKSGIGLYMSGDQYEQAGIDVVDNTAEEIAALAKEMDERLRLIWRSTKEDEELQERFWSIFRRSSGLRGVIRTRVCTEFLRQNRELLE